MILKLHFQIEQHCWATDNCCVRQQLLHFEFDMLSAVRNRLKTYVKRSLNASLIID